MGLISGILGNASIADVARVQKEFGPILAEGEEIERVYMYIRDYFVFTNGRLVMVEKQDVVGKKVEYFSIPYSRILRFSIVTAGHLNVDHELKIWAAGMSDPIIKTFARWMDIYELQVAVATYLL